MWVCVCVCVEMEQLSKVPTGRDHHTRAQQFDGYHSYRSSASDRPQCTDYQTISAIFSSSWHWPEPHTHARTGAGRTRAVLGSRSGRGCARAACSGTRAAPDRDGAEPARWQENVTARTGPVSSDSNVQNIRSERARVYLLLDRGVVCRPFVSVCAP